VAIIGTAHQVSVKQTTARGIEGIKAEYRRPALIPFPSANRFTRAKAALGKKLYFDPRLSAASSLSCASCHSPGFGWGDGMAPGVGHGVTPRRKSTGERLMAIESGLDHDAASRHASRNTHSWTGSIAPVSSASGINRPGATMPRTG
jgi:cytochrome c peroxidase